MLDTSKKISIFALRQLFNGSVNHSIYETYKRLGVVSTYSYSTAVSDCRKSGKATLSLYSILKKIKFFTNATISRKFSAAEREYAATNAQPSDRAQTTQFTQPTEKKELGKATLLPAFGLFFQEFYRYVRCVPAQVVQDFFQSFQHCHYLCTDQRQGIFRQWENFRRGVSKPNDTATLPRTYGVKSFVFI